MITPPPQPDPPVSTDPLDQIIAGTLDGQPAIEILRESWATLEALEKQGSALRIRVKHAEDRLIYGTADHPAKHRFYR